MIYHTILKDQQDYSTSLIEFVLYRITPSDCLTSHRAKIGILSMGFRVRSIQPMLSLSPQSTYLLTKIGKLIAWKANRTG